MSNKEQESWVEQIQRKYDPCTCIRMHVAAWSDLIEKYDAKKISRKMYDDQLRVYLSEFHADFVEFIVWGYDPDGMATHLVAQIELSGQRLMKRESGGLALADMLAGILHDGVECPQVKIGMKGEDIAGFFNKHSKHVLWIGWITAISTAVSAFVLVWPLLVRLVALVL